VTPLFAFLFAAPWAAAATAGAAVSIPIVIHLLSRKRFRIVPWAAMRFLLAAQKQSVRRMRLEQILLLAVRCLLLLLLVLAMASVTPWAEAFWYRLFPDSAVLAAAGSQRTHKILVLDGSFSMALKAPEGTCFDRARQKAAQIIETSSGSDGFSLLLMAAPPQRIVPEPSDDGAKVRSEIQALRLPHGNADLLATLQAVEDMVRHSPPKFEAREVYILTDLQLSTWAGQKLAGLAETMQRIQGRARVIFVDVGRERVSNVAVSNLTLAAPLATTGAETPISATLHNYGGDEPKQVRVELLVGRARATALEAPFDLRVLRQDMVTVPPGRGGLTITFPVLFTSPGEFAVQVRIEHDELEVDDARSLVVTVKDTVPVMLVNGKPAPKVYDTATEYLFDALNPFDKAQTPRNVPPRPKIVTESQFADAALGDLTPYDCVFLCDVARVGAAEVRRLETHLHRGGGVVFCLGPRVDLEAYNRLAYRNGDGLLPARLIGVQRAPEKRTFTFYAEDDLFKKPPLEVFLGDQERASLMRARFHQYMRVEMPPKSRARKVLSFMPDTEKLIGERKDAEPPTALPAGDPAVVEWSRHRGRVVLLTSSVNMDWTTWPGSPSYLVFMQELLRFAVAGRLHDQAVLVGEPIEEYLPAASAAVEVQFRTPDGRKVAATTEARDDAALLRLVDTDQSGIYVATLGKHPQEHLFAVNPPAATETQQACESDLIRIPDADLHAAYPGWEFQVVSDPKNVVRVLTPLSGDGPQIAHGMGAVIARWLLLATFAILLLEGLLSWRLGHFSKSVAANEQTPAGKTPPTAVGIAAGVAFLLLTAVLLHTWWTQDFLGFLPEGLRAWMEGTLGVPHLASGESTHWRLEYTPYLLSNAQLEPWLVGVIAAATIALVIAIYLREGQTASRPYRFLLAGLRVFLVLLMLIVLLPQLQLWFERQGWPDVAVIIDDSKSMGTTDQYRDPRVKQAAEQLTQLAQLPAAQRLPLAQALLTHPDRDFLTKLITERKVKLHIYHCSETAARIADLTEEKERENAAKAVQALGANGESSRLGASVKQVLKDFRGSSLSAVVMLTDGVTTEGEDLAQASKHAGQAGVPLFFIGLGDAHDVHDLILHDLQVEDTCFVHDRLVFEGRLTAQGYTGLPPLRVTLHEKNADGKDGEELAHVMVTPDAQGKPVKFRLLYRPAKAGEKVYVVKVAKQPDEIDDSNNRLERTVVVREAKPSRVLYVEGYARPEFRFLKTLLEREAVNEQGNKSIELKVLLLDAANDWHLQDRSARPDFPTKEELNQFDVVILGDVDPRHPKLGDKNLKLLVDFVRERGGGLLALAGKRDNPHSFRTTPLADVLPIQVIGPPPPDDFDIPRKEGFRPQLTGLGRMHPIFRFSPDEVENAAIWDHLAEMYWFAEGYRLQPAAEVLAVHPKQRALEPRPGANDEKHPLVVQHFVGNGRCLFLGFDETWAWGFRDDSLRYHQFWVQTVHYLARSRLGRIDLRLDRTSPYRRGEPIKVMVRFPDDTQPPKEDTKVEVLVQRRPLQKDGPAETEPQTMQLAKVEGSRASYEALLTPTPEGEYRFWLKSPNVTGSRPRAECKVLPPPGEMERLRMNQADMERAAEETHGKFYTLADADKLFEDLPSGSRVTLKTPGPPWLLWNHFLMFFLAIGLLGAEWALRKRKHLL
jgi:hypothetical protein